MIPEEVYQKDFDGGHLRSLERRCREQLSRSPLDPEANYWLARVAAETGFGPQAKQLLAQAMSAHADPRYPSGVADSLRRRGGVADAMELIADATQQFPDHPVLYTQLGSLHADLGDMARADEAYRRAIELDPLAGEAYYMRSLVVPFTEDDPYIGAMEAALERQLVPKRRQDICFALGRAYDQLGRFEEAFAVFGEGNRLVRETRIYDAERDRSLADRFISSFGPPLLKAARGGGHPSRVPVLIVGMPRSGTSLVEQIISAHPQAAGAGEAMDLRETVDHGVAAYLPERPQLPEDLVRMQRKGWSSLGKDYLDRLKARAGDAARITDKQLFNVRLVGMFQLMFPKAVTIHCRRDPMDTCLSCLQSLFDVGTDYIYDQEELAAYWHLQDGLMRHWSELFGDRILQVDYEELVTDPIAGSRRIIEHVGLDWDDACASPHEAKRAVGTTSMGQVRRPIYRTSVGRWRNYAPWLGPLRNALGPEVAGQLVSGPDKEDQR